MSSSRNTKKSCKFDGQVTTASMLIRLTPSLTALNMDIEGEVVELEVSVDFLGDPSLLSSYFVTNPYNISNYLRYFTRSSLPPEPRGPSLGHTASI